MKKCPVNPKFLLTDDRISALSRVANAARGFELENRELREEIAGLKDLVAVKNGQISKFHLVNEGVGASEMDEIKFLREKVQNMKLKHVELSSKLAESEEKCRKYELNWASMETALTSAEEKLRYTSQIFYLENY